MLLYGMYQGQDFSNRAVMPQFSYETKHQMDEKLKKDITVYEKNIKKAEENIKKANSDIDKLSKEIETLNQSIKQQNSSIQR